VSTVIIGGSGSAKNRIDKLNQLAQVNNWTQAQIDHTSAMFEAFVASCDAQATNPQPPA